MAKSEEDSTIVNWDKSLKEKLSVENATALKQNIENLQNVLDELLVDNSVYEKLSTVDKIKHDVFISYAVSSLYWMYMRINGKCPIKLGIKKHIDKIQEYSNRLQIVEDSKLRPTINQPVAKRVVKHELWENKLPNKKTKFD